MRASIGSKHRALHALWHGEPSSIHARPLQQVRGPLWKAQGGRHGIGAGRPAWHRHRGNKSTSACDPTCMSCKAHAHGFISTLAVSPDSPELLALAQARARTGTCAGIHWHWRTHALALARAWACTGGQV